MPGVVGQGERKHPHDGNATLYTLNLDGNTVRTPLWIATFATDLNLQIDSAQRRRKLSHRPIRITERFLVFTTLWNVRKREKYTELVDKIKEHWAVNLNEDRPTPMRLVYYGANKTWRGYIEGASFAYAVTDVVLSYAFQMRLIPDVSSKISRISGKNPAPFVPHKGDIEEFGPDWFTYSEYVASVVGTNNEGNRGADNSPDPTNTGGSGGGKGHGK